MKVKIIISTTVLVLVVLVVIIFNLKTETVNTEDDIKNLVLNKYTNEKVKDNLYYKYINEDSMKIEDIFENTEFCFVTFLVTLPDTELRLIGDAVLEKGAVGKYKYYSGGLSTNLIKNRVVKIKDKYYLYIYGYNYNGEIAKIVAVDGKKRYEFDTMDKSFYTKEFLVDENIEDINMISSMKYTIYNKEAEDITKEIKHKHNKFFN